MSAQERPAAWSIQIDDLSYTYPGRERPALSAVSLRVEPGEHVAVVGPNGAGKSTLLLHLNGILLPAGGSVRIGDLTVEPAALPEIRNRVGLVFQEPDDQLFMPTLLEDVTFGPLCQGLATDEARRRARAALESVGLGEVDANRAAHHLSGGEKRRAALATVLTTDPGVLAFDEPSAGLDGRGRRTVAALLQERSQTVIIVTHDVEFAAAVCPRMVLMDGGDLVADRPSRDLLEDGRLLRQHGLELARWLHESQS
ncbi:MAG: ABC transporter ATP-binding protein [Gemmatimonadetes bacterium]|uniref:ABC transporter ATP-binding protein n=1 Tax=Candidatus Kutchimonas denitrificans TaxID=3056748 RepID=A0AAE4Z838_9BACT|nr:ABC transporter ATP-binding protein [Gemmatimonadota bacterium]NIR75413.1 ABC transporter ATP-binding protein [Candidatus Kutchimonas denitrificans]NIS01727.1 ABC transporter ATP-binding protein [Gemmatimonadota bacterium]NIT67509.1 ABC transporter ATP-binding protein [Gemmatimonadota bacterium]NIU53372.1 ATP-binding cassette domain-containing protein [Gemmatimonadota bacterium]